MGLIVILLTSAVLPENQWLSLKLYWELDGISNGPIIILLSTASELTVRSLIQEALDCLQTTTVKYRYFEPAGKQKK